MRTLLVAFNKSIADEQALLCGAISHVRVCTLDALAFAATRDVHRGQQSSPGPACIRALLWLTALSKLYCQLSERAPTGILTR